MDIDVPLRELGAIDTIALSDTILDLEDVVWHEDEFRQKSLASSPCSPTSKPGGSVSQGVRYPRGFGIKDSRIQRTDRLGRRVPVMALALYWAVSTGMWDVVNKATPAEKNP